jgi:hypothetical protein
MFRGRFKPPFYPPLDGAGGTAILGLSFPSASTRQPMNPRSKAVSPPPRPAARGAGFVRHDLYLAAALLLVALALAVPRLLRGDWLGALGALLSLAGLVLALLGLLVAGQWLQDRADRPGWGRGLALALGSLLPFGLWGLIGAGLASALAANHRLGKDGANLAAGLAGGLTGLLGLVLYHRLGKARFWPLSRRFALALLGSFLGGILGILGPEPWSIDAGLLVPLGLFLALALSGRLRSSPPAEPPEPGDRS